MVSPLATLRRGVLRPRDAAHLYTQPGHQFQYWEEEGILFKIAHGYYALVPEARRGLGWRPDIEALALGIGQADYGKSHVALMHISAARLHGAIPRALAVAVLAVPKQRPALETKCGRVIFVKRNVGALKRVRTEMELATGWVTSVEQTALDLARRPNLVEGLSQIATEAAVSLFARSKEGKLQSIAREERMGSALVLLRAWMKNA